MSHHEEEQALEMEALQSLFEDDKEFTQISDKEFLLKLVPYPAGEEENHVAVTLHVTYTPTYPDVAPTWVLEDIKGLSDDKLVSLRTLIVESVASSLGMAMIYTVSEAIRDFLKANNFRSRSMHEEMMDRLAGKTEADDDDEDEDEDEDEDDDEPEEEEWKGLADKELCPVEERITPDSFAAWRVKFEEEMVACGVIRRDDNKAKTGKQIFMESQGEPTKDGTAVDGAGKDVFVYDAALFGEDAAEDLDDLSAGED